MKGPAIFLAQYMDDLHPFDTLDHICEVMAGLGYKGVQIPTWDKRCVDLELLTDSRGYASEIKSIVAAHGMEISELASHLQGHMMAVHPAYDAMYNTVGYPKARVRPEERTEWAVKQMQLNARASRNLGIDVHATFSGTLLWPYLYPWPQRQPGLVELGFKELARRWLPVLNVFEDQGVDLCFEIHPGEDLHDGITFERFFRATGRHSRVHINYDPSHFILQQLDYLQFIDIYHQHIKMFHVKDAEFNPNGRSGVYGGYQEWIDRPGRFRSPGDGQINFKGIFSKLAQYGYTGWAVLEWECCLKDAMQGAKEGAQFISDHIIPKATRAFDEFSGENVSDSEMRKMLGLDGDL